MTKREVIKEEESRMALASKEQWVLLENTVTRLGRAVKVKWFSTLKYKEFGK